MPWAKLMIVAVFAAVIYNLAAALWYMMSDQGQSKRMVNALSWRIGLSVGLIGLVMLAIALGWIEPHGIRPPR
ncbi:MAG: membrane protein [Lysobacterales bacterium]|jgi:succinate dehydrogenase/fumarate reductase cytochrome b subunit|nr:MAG: membrane protein [Xanthomonadales bacterium]